MGLDLYYNQMVKIEKDIAETQKKIADESGREVSKQQQIDALNRSINKYTPTSSIQSKQNQMRNLGKDIANIQKKKADLYKKLSDHSQSLSRKKIEVAREEKTERERINREQKDMQRNIDMQIYNHRTAYSTLVGSSTIITEGRSAVIEKEYDFFISHASEDKDFVRPLCSKLQDSKKRVWLDESVLTVGDSLRRKIDEGLKNSRFGIVILSTHFFKKNWTQHELDGLVAREMNGIKVILPIWHKVSKDEVYNYSPTLAGKLALNSSIHSIDEIIIELLKVL
jgi:hypothetical protein